MRFRFSRFLLLALSAALPAAASAQRDDRAWLDDCRSNRWNNDRENCCEVRIAGFRLGGRTLSVDAGQNGGISIHAWDGDSVELHERIQAQAHTAGEAADIGRQIRVEIQNASVRAEGPSLRGSRSWSVSYDIWVPRSAGLDLQATNGGIGITGTRGRVDARTVNGPLSLNGLSGDVHGRTSNGPLNVTLTGKRWEGGSLDAETTNGAVVLQVPEDYSARLITGTVNGPMRFDFPLTIQGRIDRRIDTNIGGGGPTVRAITTNGPIALRRP